MDKVSKVKRSEIMSRVKSKGSRMEMTLMNELDRLKFKYEKHATDLPGTPDIVFRNKKVVIFLDSCFWHGCRWHGTMPSSNKKFWLEKIERNKARDKKINREYKKMGWEILRFWEHNFKKGLDDVISKIKSILNENTKKL